MLIGDIYRIKATQVLNASAGVDIERVRTNFARSVALLGKHPNDNARLQVSNSLFEWASLELAYGDWARGEALGRTAIALASSLPPTNPIVGDYIAQYEGGLQAYIRKPGQEAAGCPEAVAAAVDQATTIAYRQ
jgi:hypothetical protein